MGTSIKFKNNNYEFQWAEQHSIISSQYWAEGSGMYALGIPKKTDWIEISNKTYVSAYASQKMTTEWSQASNRLLAEKNRKEILNASKKIRDSYWKLFKKFKQANLSNFTNDELFKLLKQYYIILTHIAENFAASYPTAIFAISEGLKNKLNKRKTLHLMNVLITPIKQDIIIREQLDLNKISQKKVSDRNLNKHALKHAWMFYNSYDEKTNLQFLKTRLGENFDPKERDNRMKNVGERQKKIFDELNDKEIKNLSLFLQDIGIERLELKDCWAGAEYRFLSLFKELSKRINLSLNEMMQSYTLQDYEKVLLTNNRLPEEIINKRAKNYVFWKYKTEIKLIDDPKECLRLIDKFSQIEMGINKKQLTAQGETAHPGHAIGSCRIVETKDISQVLNDLKRFKKGDILVTHMTQPNMMPIARKAAAIIADEGGITSHAAIIARELGVPCIVGAKNATQIFKDGDLVKVDAEKGIIKKLNKF